uniref:Uncharacterized protein n=1 Tax=Arundo donax TaxID=35708 RepID=A0A0A9HSK3_ARUDO
MVIRCNFVFIICFAGQGLEKPKCEHCGQGF